MQHLFALISGLPDARKRSIGSEFDGNAIAGIKALHMLQQPINVRFTCNGSGR